MKINRQETKMGCASCNNKKININQMSNATMNPPYNANDIFVLENNEVREFNSSDWNPNTHKLLLFYPSSYTPVCGSEMGALNNWIDHFKDVETDVFPVSTDPIRVIRDWFNDEESLKNPKYKVLSSYLLTARLNLLEKGRAKRASVFITKDGEVFIHEYPFKVGRSLAELHRMAYAYNTDSYCGEGWKDPSNGFLTNDNN